MPYLEYVELLKKNLEEKITEFIHIPGAVIKVKVSWLDRGWRRLTVKVDVTGDISPEHLEEITKANSRSIEVSSESANGNFAVAYNWIANGVGKTKIRQKNMENLLIPKEFMDFFFRD